MTKMEQAFARLQTMSASDREMMLDMILGFRKEPQYRLTEEQREEVRLGLKEADAGDFATEAELDAMWKKFGL